MKKALLLLALAATFSAFAAQRTIRIKSRYLNFPISHSVERQRLTFSAKGADELTVVARLTAGTPEYWTFKDMSAYRGKTLTLTWDGAPEALDAIQEADTIVGAHSMYKEENRPQFHFTTRRGWINDPNGLLYHNGTYHLYYQHNPMEREWENMTWGHATSTDLLHWTEQPTALHPDQLGTMFSGSAIFDAQNTSGFGTKRNPPIVYAYTAEGKHQTQCIAYSLDGGMTLQKYDANPVIDSNERWHSHDTRDPRLLWYAPGNHWSMVLNERDGHSIYTSPDLRQWTFQSHTRGFWECPDLFELPVDGRPDDTRWVMLGASNTYMLGRFDGKKFTPEGTKHRFTTGTIYAAQTVTGMTDGRRVQIGWGRVDHAGMPFNGMMLLPTELQLVTTVDGIRLRSFPIREVETLLTPLLQRPDTLSAQQANDLLAPLALQDAFHLHFTLHQTYSTSAGIALNGQNLLDSDMNSNLVNGQFYSQQDPTQMALEVDIYVDRTSVEVFIDHGLYSYSLQRSHPSNAEGLRFWGTDVEVADLRADRVKSVWE